jgi:hypothetical protein
MSNSNESPKPFWVRPRKATQIGGFGLTKCYELINSGALETIKIDGMRLVSVASIEKLGQHDEGGAA